jgi:fermentation-respiration switch protein FrsA (DUF1100 family)
MRKVETSMKKDFRFKSAGQHIIGNLFLPDQSQPAGIVITTGPLTSVKEQSQELMRRRLLKEDSRRSLSIIGASEKAAESRASLRIPRYAHRTQLPLY